MSRVSRVYYFLHFYLYAGSPQQTGWVQENWLDYMQANFMGVEGIELVHTDMRIFNRFRHGGWDEYKEE